MIERNIFTDRPTSKWRQCIFAIAVGLLLALPIIQAFRGY
jgi:hypothetical protein